MDRKKRYTTRKAYKKRLEKCKKSNDYVKRVMTTDKACHYILFPVNFSTVGKSNDFFLRILNLCWNDKNLQKDTRCREMFRGLHLQKAVKIADLPKSPKTGWFISSRKTDLAKIGKVAGYFIRRFACSVGSALDDTFNREVYTPIINKHFNECVNALKDNKTIMPVVVKLEISSESCFDNSRFISLNDDLVNNLTSGVEIVGTRKAKLLKIKTELHDWAWQLLNSPTLEQRTKLLNDGILPKGPPRNENEGNQPQISLQTEDRRASCRTKHPSRKYPTQIFKMN